jgi:thymidylate synthase
MIQHKVGDIRKYFINALTRKDFIIDKTGVKTIELINAGFEADKETIFGAVNYKYVNREIQWYESQSLNVNDIPEPIPEIWKQVADKDGFINSNYGWAIWSDTNGNQYQHVLSELKTNPNSRRATMIYTRPSMWQDYNKNGRSDFMCTNAVQYLIRNNRLNAIVQMRSNDVVFGYRNDRAWQMYVLEKLAKDLKLPVGKLYWSVGSLHIYERHFDLVQP